jgi:hypothetical protein
MAKKDFIIKKLDLIKKDKQPVFEELAEPLKKLAENGKVSGQIKVPADGNWFNVSFDAIQVKEDRAVISAHRIYNGMVAGRYDPSLREFRVEFQGTRAAYIFGEYHTRHPIGHWPYISWDVRSYANHPLNQDLRIYVNGFRAHNEIRRLVIAMQTYYGTRNIVNSYIKDNLQRFKLGIASKKTPAQIEKAWSQGLMESLGYMNVEASGSPKGTWNNVKVHWFKDNKDALNGQ